MQERYLYLFVRQDIPLEHQIVQSNHALLSLCNLRLQNFGVPNIVLIGVPDVKALERVLEKLKKNQIVHFCWTEPDLDMGFTSIATAPLSVGEKDVLRNYRLWKHNNGSGPGQPACGLTPDASTNSRVAQLQSTGL